MAIHASNSFAPGRRFAHDGGLVISKQTKRFWVSLQARPGSQHCFLRLIGDTRFVLPSAPHRKSGSTQLFCQRVNSHTVHTKFYPDPVCKGPVIMLPSVLCCLSKARGCRTADDTRRCRPIISLALCGGECLSFGPKQLLVLERNPRVTTTAGGTRPVCRLIFRGEMAHAEVG